MAKLNVLDKDVRIYSIKEEDYISLLDIARYTDTNNPSLLVRSWFGNRDIIEFLGIWEHNNNPEFNTFEFEVIKIQASLPDTALSTKQWVKST
jgi:hypothetical protein